MISLFPIRSDSDTVQCHKMPLPSNVFQKANFCDPRGSSKSYGVLQARTPKGTTVSCNHIQLVGLDFDHDSDQTLPGCWKSASGGLMWPLRGMELLLGKSRLVVKGPNSGVRLISAWPFHAIYAMFAMPC